MQRRRQRLPPAPRVQVPARANASARRRAHRTCRAPRGGCRRSSRLHGSACAPPRPVHRRRGAICERAPTAFCDCAMLCLPKDVCAKARGWNAGTRARAARAVDRRADRGRSSRLARRGSVIGGLFRWQRQGAKVRRRHAHVVGMTALIICCKIHLLYLRPVLRCFTL